MAQSSPQKKHFAQAGTFSGMRQWFRSSTFRSVPVFLLAAMLIFALYYTVCAPKQYDLVVGCISRETINATKDVVDEVTTEEKRSAAAAAVEPTYRFQEGVKEEVLGRLQSVFGELRTVHQYAMTLRGPDGKVKSTFTDEEIQYAMGLVTEITLTRYQVGTLLRSSPEAFEEMVTTVTTAVENSLNTTIREGQVNQAIQTILQIVGFKLDLSLTQNIVPTVLRSCVKPNMIIEQETTEIARQAARDAVEPIVYLQGQNIVREGDRVTRSQLEMLRALGLLKDNHYDYSVYGGAALIILLSMLSLLLGLRLTAKRILQDLVKISVVMISVTLCVAFSVLAHLFFSAYFVPMTFAPMLLTVLLGPEAGYASIIPTSILISGLAAGNGSSYLYEMILLLIMGLVGGTCAVRFLKGHSQRIRILLGGFISSVLNVLAILAIKWMTSTESVQLVSSEPWAVGGGLLSGVLALALQPVFESVFRLATPSRLQELCNPNQPLLRRLQLEAPGTYHHALIVANLAEAAAEKIGANPYLARAAGYYHDIGKLKRPQYFKENQMGDNPHDSIDPYVSAAILTSHTRDGYQMAAKERMPKEMMDIILQHHGDTPVMYFYHKALQLSDGTPVDIREFRYEGPRPNTRESAIVMLADTIEAAVRSMPDPTPKAINQFIEQLVRGKLEDGQLSDSPLTLRDIDEICEAFSGVLMGVFHERIEYPEVRHHVPNRPVFSEHASQPPQAVSRTEKADPVSSEQPVQNVAEHRAPNQPSEPSESTKETTNAKNNNRELFDGTQAEQPVSAVSGETDTSNPSAPSEGNASVLPVPSGPDSQKEALSQISEEVK